MKDVGESSHVRIVLQGTRDRRGVMINFSDAKSSAGELLNEADKDVLGHLVCVLL